VIRGQPAISFSRWRGREPSCLDEEWDVALIHSQLRAAPAEDIGMPRSCSFDDQRRIAHMIQHCRVLELGWTADLDVGSIRATPDDSVRSIASNVFFQVEADCVRGLHRGCLFEERRRP
jgi:hypothetical protein